MTNKTIFVTVADVILPGRKQSFSDMSLNGNIYLLVFTKHNKTYRNNMYMYIFLSCINREKKQIQDLYIYRVIPMFNMMLILYIFNLRIF